MAHCEALTKKQQPCPNDGATLDPISRRWLCHVHHPRATFRQQVQARQEKHAQRIRRRPALPDTPPLKDRF